MALGHGGGGHGGGGRGYGWGGGGFTYLVDNSDYALQPVDTQPAGNTISVTCPSSNPFEDHCDIQIETQRSGGIAGPDPRQVSRRIVTTGKRLAPVHAGRALVRQRIAPAVRAGFLPGLGAAPTGKPKPKPAGQKVLIVTPAAEASWWEAMLSGPVGALQVAAMPKAPTVRTVIVPAAKPKPKPKAPKKASAPMPAGSSPVSGLGIDIPLPADDSGGGEGDDSGSTIDFTVAPSSAGATNISMPGSTPGLPPGAVPVGQQGSYMIPQIDAGQPVPPAPVLAVPFANSQYTPAPLAPQPYLGPGTPAAATKVISPPSTSTPAPASSGPSLFSQLTSSISSLATTGAPALAAVYKTKAAQAAAKTAQAQAQQQSLLEQAAAAAKKPSNLPIILIGGGAVLLTVVMLLRRN
jgi:hypothetical protein